VVRLDGVLIDSDQERRLIADCVYGVVVDLGNLIQAYGDLPHLAPELLVFEFQEGRIDVAANTDTVRQRVPARRPLRRPVTGGLRTLGARFLLYKRSSNLSAVCLQAV